MEILLTKCLEPFYLKEVLNNHLVSFELIKVLSHKKLLVEEGLSAECENIYGLIVFLPP